MFGFCSDALDDIRDRKSSIVVRHGHEVNLFSEDSFPRGRNIQAPEDKTITKRGTAVSRNMRTIDVND